VPAGGVGVIPDDHARVVDALSFGADGRGSIKRDILEKDTRCIKETMRHTTRVVIRPNDLAHAVDAICRGDGGRRGIKTEERAVALVVGEAMEVGVTSDDPDCSCCLMSTLPIIAAYRAVEKALQDIAYRVCTAE
jgi:hypothetical protein